MITAQLKTFVSQALENTEVAEWYAEQHGILTADDVTDGLMAKTIIEDGVAAGVVAANWDAE
ncbi:hypothetical protein JFK97_06715 [Chromobacterium phragmitis]|uniref:hypothetical protein n=1 Tax=Chromobacterium amazonense TaxID=1382803 RepID=UPI0021B81D9D|nr:hypothetical protein [Chromobacterium amazonense]MBM2884079.1 hypothetical protein [Chromobacterium amazonense]MDE1715769.1 hypothetical protein [Chromobacterium amazonense]